MRFSKLLAFFVFLLVFAFTTLSALVFAATTYSGWLTNYDVFSLDGNNFTVQTTGNLNEIVIRGSVGTLAVQNGTCQVMSDYEFCVKGRRYQSSQKYADLDKKDKINSLDVSEYQISAEKVTKSAEMKIDRKSSKLEMLVGDYAKVDVRTTNIGHKTATDYSYEEVFPKEALVEDSSPTLTNGNLVWRGAVAADTFKDFFYTISFEKAGTYVIRAYELYYDGSVQQKKTNDLTFKVKNPYDFYIPNMSSIETYEDKNLLVVLKGNPQKLLDIKMNVPEGLKIKNTTFDKKFGNYFWMGNLTKEKNFSIDLYSEREGIYNLSFDVAYKGSNFHDTYSIIFNMTNKKIDYDLVLNQDSEIKVFTKNDNRFTAFSDVQISMISKDYFKKISLPQLLPKQNKILLSEKFADAAEDREFKIDTTYFIGTKKYTVSYTKLPFKKLPQNTQDTSQANTPSAQQSSQGLVQKNFAENKTEQQMPKSSAATQSQNQKQAQNEIQTQPLNEQTKSKGIVESILDFLSGLFG